MIVVNSIPSNERMLGEQPVEKIILLKTVQPNNTKKTWGTTRHVYSKTAAQNIKPQNAKQHIDRNTVQQQNNTTQHSDKTAHTHTQHKTSQNQQHSTCIHKKN